MDIISKRQFSLRHIPYYKLHGLKVAIIDSDSEARSMYAKKISEANIEALLYSHIKDFLAEQDIVVSAVVLNPTFNNKLYNLSYLQDLIKKNELSPVITISGMMSDSDLDAIMKLGVSFHINRNFSHPRDLLIAIEQLVQN